jgi:NTP pyrophosphatase (non-canonical NTP hydrolase)
LEVKSKHVEELTEVADVVEIVDEDEQIQQEVRKYTSFP